jgi:cysteine desulfurase/selenocysteine lyase
MSCFDPLAFRQHFPLLTSVINNVPLVYFDNAATTQKPQVVIDATENFYSQKNANVHRASHALSARATSSYERSRERVSRLINAREVAQIIWTKGTTEAINLVAHSWGLSELKPGDEIVLSQSEHHANIVPWQLVAQQTGAMIKVLPLSENGTIALDALDHIITHRTRILCCAHVSNVLGRINPIEQIIKKAKSVGAITLIDGAQAMAHIRVDVQTLDCDFYVFSAHKMYGPTGVGVLYGKRELLENMPPYQSGGEMIKQVSFNGTSFNSLPFKFEAGTPNIAGVVAFASAIDFMAEFDTEAMFIYEQALIEYLIKRLRQLPAVNLIVKGTPDIGVIAFTLTDHHNHDIATLLDSQGIALRSGHHCAMPLMDYLQIKGCLRISLAAYNTREEIDYCIDCLENLLTDETMQAPRLLDSMPSHQASQLASKGVVAQFSALKGWDNRHRAIMLLGKQLPRMAKDKRNDNTLISGCESQAWLDCHQDKDGNFYFSCDSDAKIIRGLLVIILAALDSKTANQIQTFDINGYFKTLGLMQHLSPSRGNGVQAIVAKILAFTEQP